MVARRKRHHTVTRAVLEGFSQRGQVVTRCRRGQEFSQSIRNATVVADFYSFDNEGSPDDAVEGWLATVVESNFTALLPGLRRGEQPSPEMRPAIARFLAAAVVRTRTARSYLEQIDHHIAGSAVLLKVAPELGWDLAEMSAVEVDHLRQLCQRAWRSLPPSPDKAAGNLRVIVRQSRQIEDEFAQVRVVGGYERGAVIPGRRRASSRPPRPPARLARLGAQGCGRVPAPVVARGARG